MADVGKAWNINDLREMAQKRVPKYFFDYLDGGANSETTMRANESDFAHWRLRQKVLTGAESNAAGLNATYLGAEHRLPILLGPVGFAGMYWPHGEIAAGRAADEAGIGQCLSTFSICSLEDVAAARFGPLYFQLYMFRNRDLTEDILARCRQANVDVIFLTVDTCYIPIRERDARNGFRADTRLSARGVWSMLKRPGWCVGALSNGMPKIGNVLRYPDLGASLLEQSAAVGRMIDSRLSWADVKWLRARWPGKIVIKGILDSDDARRAVDEGVDGILISNHGGRQLDPAPSAMDVLPEIADAVGERTEILMDGGVRRGADVIKALALGASAVSIGRAYIYGLGAAGEKGVARCLELLKSEMLPALNMMGFESIAELRAAGKSALRMAGAVHGAVTAAAKPDETSPKLMESVL
ncbi:alpha-hydroxy acid oxidase [Burkholderia oklahomensis]|uniref:Dihydroorotate dehydrogenase family protein n=1 Tax=Burkholderia oklahomensis TaxID=342113 RepID=A0AAI8BAI9_9BURK|nr:alpha-hydroxy acid oxidase [Burkholderia oklahomensis]AIO68737.1 dihydroorotate dehydrogenase family protein [Burkholderia oklahomensis]AOI38623.1 alpha-hydroxy-acid oxidizing enzyme [Burkholderia oklahomensis EO147]KUY48254.1 alpha-hydroxy-acid oxidizing enzyme [Burkholderia oklahomensis EO147]QPS41026.1 alpha-hydroxy-acid oxidizing protein [Burkholderia oklahomensis]